MSGKISESQFQHKVIKEIKKKYEDAIVMKLDANYKQGIPDFLILVRNKWATLEFKKFAEAKHRPNQDWYVDQMNRMSFSRFIFPENKDEVLRELFDFFDLKG